MNALFSGERVLLSTATKTLQEQIFSKDLPFTWMNTQMTIFDVGGLAGVVMMVLMLSRRVIRNLTNLARLEPARRDGRT